MKGYVLRRIGLFIPTILLTTVIVFALFFLVPGDAALFILTGEEGAGAVTEEDLQKLRQELGLDRPVHIQYFDWLWNTLRGDLGISIWYRQPVTDEIRTSLPLPCNYPSWPSSWLLSWPCRWA